MGKAVIFDFDGVITDSNRIKEQGYYAAFSGVKGSQEVVRKVLARYPASTRESTIKKIVAGLAGCGLLKSGTDIGSAVSKYVDRYARIADDAVCKAHEIKGVRGLLDRIYGKAALFINSATPDDSLAVITRKKGLDRYFTDIYGSTHSKKENLSAIRRRYGFRRADTLYIGDRDVDYMAACADRIAFIAFKGEFPHRGKSARNAKELERLIDGFIKKGKGADK
ncbi:MAG: HAD hydrolase-like protein [Candidatus Omnitrophica bacterium]|nr:HAD hydrolase-like protein [Candidatus Omnitrophota bacterium]